MSRMKESLLGDTPWTDLFGAVDTHTRVRTNDPVTSREAVDSIINKLRGLRSHVYDAFKSVHPHGMTDLDLQRRFDNHRSTYRTRRAELVELGLLKDSGRRVFQEGSNRIVWVLKER